MRYVLPLAFIALASCARDGTVYPSLAVRPAEARGFGEPEEAPPAPVPADPVLDARVAAIGARLSAIATGFDRDAQAAATAAGRAGARTVGGDAWLEAQTRLAALDDWRAQASEIATDAAALASARAAELVPDYPALDRVEAAAAAEVARQDERIRAIAATLPTG